jgi:hypothetical protein
MQRARCIYLGQFTGDHRRKHHTMKLHFNRAGVERLLAHAEAATKHKKAYAEKGKPKPALWIVGDEGVYLMSNGEPGLPIDAAHSNVVYAREVDPTKMPFDQWWQAKRESFGGDDGADTLSAVDLRNALARRRGDLVIEMNKSTMVIG